MFNVHEEDEKADVLQPLKNDIKDGRLGSIEVDAQSLKVHSQEGKST